MDTIEEVFVFSCSVVYVFIENEIGVKASVANPAENLTLAADIDAEKFKKDASSLMLCCGLALSKRSD